MGMTMTQKILAAHAGKDCVCPGELIEARLDLVLGNDVTTPVAITEFENAGFTKVFDRDKIEKVVSVGYMDEEQFAVYDKVNETLAKVRAGEMTIEDLINARPPKPELEPEGN